MFKKRKREKMIEELKSGHVVIGKYMDSGVMSILAMDDLSFINDSACSMVKQSGDIHYQKQIEKDWFSTMFSIKNGEYLIPLATTEMVNAYQYYRGDLKEGDSVIGFAKEIKYDKLSKVDIEYIYNLYQEYKQKQITEKGKTYQLKK